MRIHNESSEKEMKMRMRTLRNCFKLGMITLVFTAGLVSGFGQQEEDAAQQHPDRSKIWGWWPEVPWDDRPVSAPAWAEFLNRPISLVRKGKSGDKHLYRIRRINLTVDREGKAVSRITAEGELSRTLVEETQPGVWTEICKWERFAAAQGMGLKSYPSLKELPSARGVSFEFLPRSFNYVNPQVDFSRVDDDALGYLLKILTIDAMGFDSIILSLRDRFEEQIRIGETSRHTEWKPWEITHPGSEDKSVSYHAGELQTSVIGLTRFCGEPCVLVWFSMEGNSVIGNMETTQFTMNMKSTEYFRGEIAASLLDGRLVGFEFWGPLPCVMEMGFGGKKPTEQPIGAIIQQVSMWEIPSIPEKDPSSS